MRCAGAILFFALGWAGVATAQAGALRGVVTDSATGDPLDAVHVLLTGGDSKRAAQTDGRGQYSFTRLAPGAYTLHLTRVGYRSTTMRVTVRAEVTSTGDVTLVAVGIPLVPLVVSVTRSEQAALDAPASVSVIDPRDFETTTALTPIEHVRGVAGVDIATKGLIQHTVSYRGTNTANSGDVLVLHDFRYTAVPAINLNVPYLVPAAEEDVERIEVMRGPGAAVFGPGAPRGVLHVITRSPFESRGGAFSLTAGTRSVVGGSARYAGLLGGSVAYRISADFVRGDDWRFADPVEQQERGEAIAAGADPDTLLIAERDFDLERFAGQARVDWRPGPGTEAIAAVGFAQAGSAIDLTPAAGAVQARDWRYSFGQVRLHTGRLRANVLYNWSNAGDTYLLRSGDRLVDDSRVLVAQLQHETIGRAVNLVYGADVRWTNPRTEGTIHGANEDDDLVAEIGGYIHAVADVAPRWALVGAVRVDHHNRLSDLVLSPRAGVVFKPSPTHAVRLTYNRAFTSPDANDLFLDLRSDRIALPGGFGYDVRAVGVPKNGFTFRRDCNGLCMRSPFNLTGGAGQYLPADATVLWPALVAFAQLQGVDLSALPAPTAQDVQSRIAVLGLGGGFVPVDAGAVEDIAGEGRTITNTVELGYKGLIAGRLGLSVDVWVNRISDIAGALQAGTPNVFFDQESLERYLAGFLPADSAAALADLVSQIPVGTISPQETRYPTDILILNRRGGAYTLWGVDLGFELALSAALGISGSVSLVSSDSIADVAEVGTVFLNAPRTKASFGVTGRSAEVGLDASVRGRAVADFPVASGVYGGRVERYAVVDATVGYRPRFWPRARVTVSAMNLLDNRHREFVGAPRIGRLIVSRLRVGF